MTVLDERIQKAEADYQSAVDLSRRRREPLPDVVCYHCQQAAEKYLKAYLVANGVTPPTIHDLEALVALCARLDTLLAALDPLAQILDPYGVLIRYPGRSATVLDARDALKAARRFRTVLRRRLGLPPTTGATPPAP